MPRRGALLLVVLVAACGSAVPDASSQPNGGPPGIIVVTSGGTALQDGATDVPPTLDLRVVTSSPPSSADVTAALDGAPLTLHPEGDGLVATTPPMPLGSDHHLDIDIIGRARQSIGFHVVEPAAAAAALHTDPAGAAVLDIAFALAPDQAAVAAALAPGGHPTWPDPEHLRATFAQAPGGRLTLPDTIGAARGSHLAGGLSLDLRPVPRGSLRRALTSPPPPAAAAGASPFVIAFSVDTTQSRQSAAAHAGQISVISPTGVVAGPDGSISGVPDAATVTTAVARGLPVWPLVQNRSFDTAAAAQLLHDSAAVERLVAALRSVAAGPGMGGIDLDFENVDPADKDVLTGLVRQLASGLHADGHRLAVAVIPHKPGHLNAYSAADDLRGLAAAADVVTVMAYEEHGDGTGPGAVDSLPWVQQVLAGTLSDLDPAHTLLGLSAYARRWSATDRYADSYASAVATALTDPDARVDEDFDAQAPFVKGGDGSLTYFDDALSMAPKLALVGPLHLEGLAVWRLGFEDPAVWSLLPATAPRPG